MAGSFLLNNESNTPPLYRFKLLRPDTTESIILKHEPLEWGDGTIEVDRDISIGGVFTQFSVDSLTFIKEGANFIRTIWDEKEINGECDLIIYWFKFSTRTYVEMPSRFSLNFATIKPRVKIQNIGIGVEVETVKSSFLVKLENRRKEKVDLTRRSVAHGQLQSIGGASIIDYEADRGLYSDLKKMLNFGSYNIQPISKWHNASAYDPKRIDNDNGNGDKITYTKFDMYLGSNELDNSFEVRHQTNIVSETAISSFFVNASTDIEITFFYTIKIDVTNRKFNQKPYTIYLKEYDVSNNELNSWTLANFGNRREDLEYTDSITFTIGQNNKLKVFVKTDAVKSIDAYITYSGFGLYSTIANTDSRQVESFPIYEAIERTLQLITDTQFPFYSEFFGRIDTVYNQDGDVYLTENQLRFANIMSGLNIRGANFFDRNNPLPVSFDDLFQTIKSIWNVGYEIETRDNFNRVRIEDYDYFFENTQVLDLSSRLSQYDIETETIPELSYSSFETGFEDFDYELQNGRGEYNTKSLRNSVLNTDSKFNNVSKIRGDSQGIIKNLNLELTTEDSTEDNSLFIIKTQRDGDEWIPESTENIQILYDSSLFGDDSFNLYFTPTRNLRRHGNRIKGAFLKYLNSYITFQSGSKKQDLFTTGEGRNVYEGEDILVNDLDEPIFKPIKHIVTVKFTLSDFEILMNNPKGYIKLSDTISGYLLNLRKKNGEDRATIEVIEKYN